MRYNRLQQNVFTVTIQAVTVSIRNNWHAQVYSTEFGWSRVHLIKNKGYAHKTLYLLFKRYGVPPKMVMYGSKDQTLVLFRKKYQEADFHINQTDTHPHGNYRLRRLSGIWRRALLGRWSNLVHLRKYGTMHWILRPTWGHIQTWMFICYMDNSLRQWCWMELLISENYMMTGSMIGLCLGTIWFNTLTKIRR